MDRYKKRTSFRVGRYSKILHKHGQTLVNEVKSWDDQRESNLPPALGYFQLIIYMAGSIQHLLGFFFELKSITTVRETIKTEIRASPVYACVHQNNIGIFNLSSLLSYFGSSGSDDILGLLWKVFGRKSKAWRDPGPNAGRV